MNHELLHIRGNLAPQLGLVGNVRGLILRDSDPDLLTGFHDNAVGLNRRVGALVGIDDDVLNKTRNVNVVPALSQNLHLFTGPGSESVGTIICPGPSVRNLPPLRNLDHNRNHFRVFRSEDRHRQTRYHKHDSNECSDCLFHRFSLLFFIAEPNIPSVFCTVNERLRK